MTVAQLIEMLQNTGTPDAEVEAWDPESEDWEPVTGCVYGGNAKNVRLYTDEP